MEPISLSTEQSSRTATHPVSVRVANAIVLAIEAGEFGIGQRLPPEHQLTERFNVSRPSLREALSALQFAGLIESRQGYGTVVRMNGTRSNRIATGSHRPIDVMVARLALEPEAIRLAAMSPNTEAVERAATLLEGMWVAVESASQVGADTDFLLHIAMIEACKNASVRDAAIQVVQEAQQKHWRTARSAAWTDHRTIEAWTIQHESTLAAIRAGDGNRAARSCRHHLLSVAELVLRTTRLRLADRAHLRQMIALYGARDVTTNPTVER